MRRIIYHHHLSNVTTFPLDWKGKWQGFPLLARHFRPWSSYQFLRKPSVSAVLKTWRKVKMMHLTSFLIFCELEKILLSKSAWLFPFLPSFSTWKQLSLSTNSDIFLRFWNKKTRLGVDMDKPRRLDTTSTAKEVLGNCERMVLANLKRNWLSNFILWIWLSRCTLYLFTCALVYCTC